MRDGYTRPLEAPEKPDRTFAQFTEEWNVSVVILAGGAAGSEFPLDKPSVILGRGPEVDLAFEDPAMSKEHAVVEFANGGFRVRDLGSMNGVRVNDTEQKVAELQNGDRFQLGEHVFQMVFEKHAKPPKTWVLPEE